MFAIVTICKKIQSGDNVVQKSQNTLQTARSFTTTKQFLITWILCDFQITTVWWNIGTPASQNLVDLHMSAIFNAR